MVKPTAGASVQFVWDSKTYTAETASDGFFKFEWETSELIEPGTYPVVATLLSDRVNSSPATGSASLIVHSQNRFNFISDIDDTFLVSHSARLRKRLYVLLTKNALSRRPFDSVVHHYQMLARSNASTDDRNPFFFVSSSEWNLYYYIRDFTAKHALPNGVYLLSQMKKFAQVFKTGQQNHGTKFMRIIRIMEAFPGQRFILLGDDSQEDPNIYAAVAEHFPEQVHTVYIRQTAKAKKEMAVEKLDNLENSGIHCCYFTHSSEAILHSRMIGLIDASNI